MTGKQLKRHPHVKAKILPDGYLLLYIAQIDWVYTLTPLAGLVWEFCDGNTALEEIVANITAMKEVDAGGNLKNNIARLIAEFEQAGLLIDTNLVDIPALTGNPQFNASREVEE